jgi:hypothetical protein
MVSMVKKINAATNVADHRSDDNSIFWDNPMDAPGWAPLIAPEPLVYAVAPPSFLPSGGATVSLVGQMGGTTNPMALYLTEPGDTTAISVNDLHQGSIADCFVIAVIGELALVNPGAISKMITQNSNGTETVTLYSPQTVITTTTTTNHHKTVTTTSMSVVEKPVGITVTNNFPAGTVDSSGQDVVNGVQEIWPSVLENAIATLDGGYSAISNGGDPTQVMTQLTGKPAMYYSPAGITAAQIEGWQASKDLIIMDTLATGALPDNLVNWHCYMFEGLTNVGGSTMVLLGNPWGYDQPSAVPLSQLANCFSAIAVGATV